MQNENSANNETTGSGAPSREEEWMRSERYTELIIGIFFLSFTVIYGSQIPSIRITGMSTLNSEAYPAAIAALMLVLTIWQICIGVKKFGHHP